MDKMSYALNKFIAGISTAVFLFALSASPSGVDANNDYFDPQLGTTCTIITSFLTSSELIIS